MECSKARNLINQYVEETLSEDDSISLFSHIDKCIECREQFDEMKEIHNVLNEIFIECEIPNTNFRGEVMKKIYNTDQSATNKGTVKIYHKRIAAAIIALCILVTGSFIPVNGQTLIDKAKEWVSNITIKNENGTIVAEDNGIEVSGEDYEKMKEKAKGYTPPEVPLDDMKKDMGIFFVKPGNIPDRYTFAAGECDRLLDEKDTKIMTQRFLYKTDMNREEYYGQEFLDVEIMIYTEQSGIDKNRETGITGGGFAYKETTLLEKNALFVKRGPFKELISPEYYLGDNIAISVDVAVKNSEVERNDEMFIKIAESIIEQYRANQNNIIQYYNDNMKELDN